MRFIGQSKIMRQLQFILPDLYENTDKGCNILLRGASGYGKTTMALSICSYLAGTNYQIFLEDDDSFVPRKRVIFWDEIHLLKTHEMLYHLMDSGKHVFVFATNIDGNLPEAFQNRCYQYIFEEYSEDELLLIALESTEFKASIDSLRIVIEAGNRNPRVIKSICARLNTYFAQTPEIDSVTADFKEIMENIFDIQEGLSYQCRKYMEVLQDIGGTAGFALLQRILNIDAGTILREIEPILIKKGLIRISNKGRSIVFDE